MNNNDLLDVTWVMSRKCNFKCKVCSTHNKPYQTSEYYNQLEENIHYDYESVISKVESFGRPTHFTLLGGEPFVIPNFTKICERISLNGHSIRILTNLSLSNKNLRTFLADVLKKGTRDLKFSSSVHQYSRDYESTQRFIENCHTLNEFNIKNKIYFIVLPGEVEDALKHIELFKENGLILHLKPFKDRKGTLNGKIYPRDYTKEELALFAHPDINNSLFTFKAGYCLKGEMCSTGMDALFINWDGNVFNCSKEDLLMGNIYDKPEKLQLLTEPRKCTYDFYCDCGDGYNYSTAKGKDLKQVYKEYNREK